MKISAVTRCGSGKNNSEDRIIIGGRILCNEEFTGEVPPCVIGIADGVGGNAGGDIAAQFVCERLSECATDMDGFAGVNAALLEFARKTPGKETMASTFSGIFPGGRALHIGNTRSYAVQGGYLKQITEDMTTYNYLRSLGRFEEAEHCAKNEITACFGGGNSSLFKPVVIDKTFKGKVVITSDGVHDHVELDLLENIITLSSDDLSACHSIVQSAVNKDSEDDLSVAIVNCFTCL